MSSFRKHVVAITAFVLIITSVCAQSVSEQEASALNFKEVAARLDKSGDLFFILNAEGAVEEAFKYVQKLSALAPEDDIKTAELKSMLTKLEAFLKKNGFFALQGYGVSIKPAANGMNDIKLFVRRESTAAGTPLWKGMVGVGQKELLSHKYLPADTVMVSSSTGDLKEIWKLFRLGLKELASPEVSAGFDEGMAAMSESIGVNIEQLIASIGSDGFISIQLSKTDTIQMPGSEPGKVMEVATPSLLIGLGVKDNAIIEAIKQMLSTPDAPMMTIKEGADILYSANIPFPLPFPVQPTMVLKSGMLLIGSSPDVVKDALSAAAIPSKNLMSTPEFKKLFTGLPTKNNGMTFLSERFTKTVMQFQKQALQANAQPGMPDAKSMITFYESVQGLQAPQSGANVTLNWKSGVQVKGTSTTGGKEAALSLVLFPIGLSTAIAVPAFMQYRTDTKEGLCHNNLRLIEHAKAVAAIKDNIASGTLIMEEDVTVFITGGMPTCPGGGKYTFNVIDTQPACSIHGTIK